MKKQLNVEWDDPSDLKRMISKLQKRRKKVLRDLGYVRIQFNNTPFNMDTVFPEIEAAYQAVKEEPGVNYLYFHCNPNKPLNVKDNLKHAFLAIKFPNMKFEPFYVGKGVGGRFSDLNRNDSHRKIRTSILQKGKEVEAIKVKEGVSEKTALQLENFFMYFLGLRALSGQGLLTNLQENDCPEFREICYKSDIMKKIMLQHGVR